MALTEDWATTFDLPSNTNPIDFITTINGYSSQVGRDGVGKAARSGTNSNIDCTLAAGVLSNSYGACSCYVNCNYNGFYLGYGGTGTQLNIKLGVSGGCQIKAGSTVLATTATNITSAVWVSVVVLWDIASGTKTVTVYVNGAILLSYSGSATITAMVDRLVSGDLGGGFNYLDDLWIGKFDATPAGSDVRIVSGRPLYLVAAGTNTAWYGINGAATPLAGLTGTGQAACNILNGEQNFTITNTSGLSITPQNYYGLRQSWAGLKKSAATVTTRVLQLGRRVSGSATVDSSYTLSTVAQAPTFVYFPSPTRPALADYNNTQILMKNT